MCKQIWKKMFLFISLKNQNVYKKIIRISITHIRTNRTEFDTKDIVYTIMMSHVESQILQKQNNFVRIMRNTNEILWLLQSVNLCVYAL